MIVDEEDFVEMVDDMLQDGDKCHLLNRWAKEGYDHRGGAAIANTLTAEQLSDVITMGINEPIYEVGDMYGDDTIVSLGMFRAGLMGEDCNIHSLFNVRNIKVITTKELQA